MEQFDTETLGGVESGPIRTMLTALKAGKPAGENLTAAQAASASLIDPASEFFFQQRGYDAAEIYLRRPSTNLYRASLTTLSVPIWPMLTCLSVMTKMIGPKRF